MNSELLPAIGITRTASAKEVFSCCFAVKADIPVYVLLQMELQ